MLAGAGAAVVVAALVILSQTLGPARVRLAYVSSDAVVFDDLSGARETFSIPTEVPSATLSPDGTKLAWGESRVTVLELDGGDQTDGPEGRAVGWTPGGDLVIERPGAGGRTFLARWDLEGEPVPIVVLGLGSHVGEPVWLTPDVFAVALPPRAGGDPVLHVMSVGAGTPAVLHTIANAVPLAATSTSTLLYHVPDGDVVEIAIDGSSARPVGVAGDVSRAVVGPGGRVVVAGRVGDVPGTWLVTDGEPIRLAGGPATAMVWLDTSALAVVTPGGTLVRIAVPGGEETELATGVMPGLLSLV